MARKTAGSLMTVNATTAAKMNKKGSKKAVDNSPATDVSLTEVETVVEPVEIAEVVETEAANKNSNNSNNTNDSQEQNTMTDQTQDTTTQDAPTTSTFHFRKTDTTGRHVYGIPGAVGVILIGHHFLPATPPATLELPFAGEVKTPAVKLTKEERKALRAAMTPEELLAEKRDKIAKQIANLEARKAKLGIQPLPGFEDEAEGAEAEAEGETVGAI